MIVQLAVLADGANIAHGNKLNILGAFSALAATQFPITLVSHVLALRLELVYEDGGREHALEVSLEDADGRPTFRASRGLGIAPIPPGEHQYHDEILQLTGVGFLRPGVFSYVIRWDGQEAARVPLHVNAGSPPSA